MFMRITIFWNVKLCGVVDSEVEGSIYLPNYTHIPQDSNHQSKKIYIYNLKGALALHKIHGGTSWWWWWGRTQTISKF
jgi:hypothetical protein